jgi:anti-sigma factor RsiW
MSQCREEGAIRAYLDGELPAADAALLEQHFADCAECGALRVALSARAERIGAFLMDLEGVPATAVLRSAARWKWTAAAAVAAVLALWFVVSNERHPVVSPPISAQAPAAVEIPRAAAPIRPVKPHITAHVPPTRRAAVRAKHVQYYMPLDEEPIDTGTVVRVAFQDGMQADVIVDTAGKPRAIRPLE